MACESLVRSMTQNPILLTSSLALDRQAPKVSTPTGEKLKTAVREECFFLFEPQNYPPTSLPHELK